jgi:hypothetical protein
MLIRFCATKMDLQRTRNYPIGLHPVNRQDQVGWRLMLHRRRTSQESVVQFIGGLEVGRQGLSNPGYPIGETRFGDSKDIRLVCFVCQSSTMGATASFPFFTASRGLGANAYVKTVAKGTDVLPPFNKVYN